MLKMLPFGTGKGLENPIKAEIHLNVRYHDMALEGMVADQISVPSGGCGPGLNQPNPINPNECLNFQVSYHLAPGGGKGGDDSGADKGDAPLRSQRGKHEYPEAQRGAEPNAACETVEDAGCGERE